MIARTWTLSTDVIRQTEKSFRAGQHEVFVLWTASLDLSEPEFLIRRVVVPKQKPGQTEFGVYVHIEGSELSSVQIDNYRRGERSVVQLHTHPGSDVGMSDLDREWEVVRHVGALSIIVPHYGIKPLMDFAGVNVYEREVAGWRLWSSTEIGLRLRVVA